MLGSPGLVHLMQACRTKGVRYAEAHPMAHQRGPRRYTVLSARGSWAIAPRTPGRCAPSGSSVVARSDPTTMLNWTSFRAFERGYAAGTPIRDIPRIGSAYKPKGYSSHPPNPLSILLVFFCRDNHYRCSYLSESRSTTAVRSTPITRAGGRLPCRPTNSLRLPTR